ncbi:hypothetical protein NW762_006358 [Fusarium torreyae]|uniref:Protein kinase domain-containing protein n=1 Tax=Fusarium torreyae TaxID=1237075 RepID=A0A9W8VHX3_9HYPO|nr:hypothetical protein NW762_006358 [Fusarium torreyae]
MPARKRPRRAETPVEQDEDPASISEHTDVSPAELPTMEILSVEEAFKPGSEGDPNDVVYDHTKMSVEFSTGGLAYTIINEPISSVEVGTVLDLGHLSDTAIPSEGLEHKFAAALANHLELPSDQQLVLVHIPEEAVFPKLSSSLTKAPDSIIQYCYIKRPCFSGYEADDENQNRVREVILQEAKICEILNQNPHPNIAKYWGCKVANDRILGLYFGKYVMTLQERIESRVPFDVQHCLKGIKNGILHLHSLGLIHNDINPTNIMLDPSDNPVIIDFDACTAEGGKLLKGGTPFWDLEFTEDASRKNDLSGLSKLEEWLDVPPEYEGCLCMACNRGMPQDFKFD